MHTTETLSVLPLPELQAIHLQVTGKPTRAANPRAIVKAILAAQPAPADEAAGANEAGADEAAAANEAGAEGEAGGRPAPPPTSPPEPTSRPRRPIPPIPGRG